MDSDTARVLFEQGATLVFLDAPEGMEFGVDYTSWTVGPKFKGLKMIPPGIHYIYYSTANKEGASPRSSFFHHFTVGEVVVRRWDPRTEDLSTTPVSEEEERERFIANKHELDQYLGPYPYDNYKTWVSLSSHMTEPLIERLLPSQGRISSVTEFVSERSDTQSRRNMMETEEVTVPDRRRLPDMAVVEGTQIRFTPIPRTLYPAGSSPAQITQHNLDPSHSLYAILSNYPNNLDILGEIQFAFICFLIGHVADGFEQWKKLVHLLCSSTKAVTEKPDLYKKLISVLYYHLKEVPEDFFVDIVSNDNFLVRTLHSLFVSLDSDDVDPALRRRSDQFRKHLTERFKWDFCEEPSDEAPVVVDLHGYEDQ